jgi:hypothetical protein
MHGVGDVGARDEVAAHLAERLAGVGALDHDQVSVARYHAAAMAMRRAGPPRAGPAGETDETIERIASLCGFGSAHRLRTHFTGSTT